VPSVYYERISLAPASANAICVLRGIIRDRAGMKCPKDG
jgi:hypothetical protein